MDGLAAYIGNRCVAAGWGARGDPARVRALVTGWTVVEGEGWLIAAEQDRCLAAAGDVVVANGRHHAFDRDGHRLVDAATLARDGIPPGIAAPFRALRAHRARGAIDGVTDHLGLGHLFHGAQDDVAIVATQAGLVARALDRAPDPATLAAYALFGTFLDTETPYAGVTRLRAGEAVRIAGGELSVVSVPAPRAEALPLAEAFRAAVAAMIAAAPDADLELSGGLDSRLILAAMSGAERRGRRAVTISSAAAETGDVRVARLLAERYGLDHRLIDDGGLAAIDGGDLATLLRRLASAYDHMANPLDKAVLALAADRPPVVRFGGQNGEMLRGFYHPGQPLGAPPSRVLAEKLIALRLERNDRVDPALLSPTMRGPLAEAARRRMVDVLLAGGGGSWGDALDRYYLRQRMQAWVGNSAGNRLVSHLPFWPFFDAAVVRAAMALPAGEKSESRAAYRLLVEIDPVLAGLALDNGIVPARAARGGRLFVWTAQARRIWKRVRTRIAGRGVATLGSQAVAERWQAAGLHRTLDLDRLAGTGLFDEAALAAIGDGRWLPDRPTLGFVLLIDAMLEQQE